MQKVFCCVQQIIYATFSKKLVSRYILRFLIIKVKFCLLGKY